MHRIALNTSWKAHIIFALALGLWLVAFLIFIAPFDTEDLSLKIRLMLLPPYGILLFICYMIGVALQNWWYGKTKTWNATKEAIIILTVLLIVPFFVYPYYISSWINGDYGLVNFLLLQILPTSLILTPFLIFGRKYLNKLQAKKERILLKGENKSDLLKIDPRSIISVSSAQNYVEVHYVIDDKPQKKLLRIPLRKIMGQDLGLVQVHRSHLVNPRHFVKWKDPKTALFYHLEIPISKKFKEDIIRAL